MLAWREPRRPDEHSDVENPVVKWREIAAETKSSDFDEEKNTVLTRLKKECSYFLRLYEHDIHNDLDFLYSDGIASSAKHTTSYWEDVLIAVQTAQGKLDKPHVFGQPSKIVVYNDKFYHCVEPEDNTKWQNVQDGSYFEYIEETWQHFDGSGNLLMTSKPPDYGESASWVKNLAGKPSIWKEPQFVVSPFLRVQVIPSSRGWLLMAWNNSKQWYEKVDDEHYRIEYKKAKQQWQYGNEQRKQLFGLWSLQNGKHLRVQPLT